MQVAELLGCRGSEIVFTSGGSEANNHALNGVFFARGRADARSPRGPLITQGLFLGDAPANPAYAHRHCTVYGQIGTQL